MQEKSEPTLVQQIQEAVDRGQVVVIPPPTSSPAVPPLPNKDKASLAAALCLLFKLSRAQGHVLMKLVTQDYVTAQEICAIAARNDQTLKSSDGSARAFIFALRRRLATHNVRVLTLHGVGHVLHKESRKKICRQLAKYDAEFVHTIKGARAAIRPSRPRPNLFTETNA